MLRMHWARGWKFETPHIGKKISANAGKDNSRAYYEFDLGIRRFAKAWKEICIKPGNPNEDFEKLFGEVVKSVLIRQARSLQESRKGERLGIRSSGIITSAASAI